MANPVILTSPQGKLSGEVDLNGGMLASLHLKRDGSSVSLLHRASWLQGKDYFDDLIGLDNHLSGEWACVPFGWTAQDSHLFKQQAPHGLPCHNRWEVVSQEQSKITISYSYPQDNPLEKVVRTIELCEDLVKFSFTVTAREDINTTLGAHPVFPLTGDENQLELSIHGDGLVYAIECEKGISRLKPGEYFTSLDKLPLSAGGTVDGTHLPFSYDTEEIVQMIHPKGEALLTYRNKGVQLKLTWDEKVPTCLLWISNRGRKYAPWNGQNCCLGIEPIAGAWDLADHSLEANPVNERGVPSYVSLKAQQPWIFNYAIAIASLN